MTDLIADAVAWVADTLADKAAVTVTYRRGQDSASVPAVLGQTQWAFVGPDGAEVEMATRDYIIRVSDLVLAGQPVSPQRGDVIDEAGETFEVSAPVSEPVWRWNDAYRNAYRIHTNKVG